MKRILLISVHILFVIRLAAQDSGGHDTIPEKIVIRTEEGTEKMSQGYNYCVKVLIPGVQKKDVDHDFVKYMKNFDAKGDQNKGEYFFDNASLKQLSDNAVDVYLLTTQQDANVRMEVFFDLGGAYLNSKENGNKFEIAQRMIHDFARQEAKEGVQNQIDAAQKILQSKLREHDDLVRQDTSFHKRIRDAQQTIRESEDAIKAGEDKQIVRQQEIINQQKILDALKAKEAGIE